MGREMRPWGLGTGGTRSPGCPHLSHPAPRHGAFRRPQAALLHREEERLVSAWLSCAPKPCFPPSWDGMGCHWNAAPSRASLPSRPIEI